MKGIMNSWRPSASVVITNFNYARFLPIAIDSALAQDHPRTEVIVVDDGSTDSSRGVIAGYGDRIRAVFKDNGGHGSAFNAGFEASTGDVVFFLDADDAMHEHAVRTVVGAWRDGVGLVQYRMDVIDVEGRVIGEHPPAWQTLADGDVAQQVLATGSFATTVTSGLAFSRRALEQVMPIPEPIFRQAADGYLVRAVALLGPVQALEARLAMYRRHGNNDSGLTADASDLAQFFRKKLGYKRNEYNAVRALATNLGLDAAMDLGERDAEYLGCRLLSLALDPRAHPLHGDSRVPLLMRYVARRFDAREPLVRRMADAATALGVTVLPRDAGATLVRWRQVPTTRPSWLRQLTSSYQGAQALLSR
jgi:hypothetical protein